MNLNFLTLRTLYENPTITQRELAKKFMVSLGNINNILQENVDRGYLISDVGYTITDKGIALLKENEVDAAVILACGMGLRLAPLTYDTPKSFIKIKGERMIERQIEQLKSAGINDITIMVGYLKEQFDYLIDKYNVKLIYNREYKEKNTLATLYNAREIISGKNVYICVSDVYMEENIFHKYECEPYYIGAFYEDCTNEWRYIANKKNEIKGVELGGKNDYCLVGPSFLTKSFLGKFLPLIEKYYSENGTNNFYWEDVLVRNFDVLPTICVYKLEKGVIHEFDSISDIKKYDADVKEFGSEATSFVAKVFKINESEIKNIECVKEGMTNHSYKFTEKGTTYIARVPGVGTSSFIDRGAEAEVYTKLKNKNITEDVVYFDKNSGYKISKFFDNARIVDVNNEMELRDTMELYRRFHLLNVKVRRSTDMIDENHKYLKKIKDNKIHIPYEDFDDVIKKVHELEKFVRNLNRPTTLCHGDANPGNVLYTDDGMKLIDFEYAGMADPLTDIALFGTYVNFDFDKIYMLYEMYKNTKLQSADKSKIILKDDVTAKKLMASYMAFSGMWSALWVILREAGAGVDYGSYGMRMYRVCKDGIKKALSL